MYWRDDQKFYMGEIAAYNEEDDEYEMNYDDSELSFLACTAYSLRRCSMVKAALALIALRCWLQRNMSGLAPSPAPNPQSREPLEGCSTAGNQLLIEGSKKQ